ncbi:MFS transporter [Celeribacter naphthalenivorans]|uniref:MFS transporter n=1 Tax=Celeribacter naphthalenivorans TaxID=1614694 RepID=UPI001CF9843E|nr:MFS transporter [Celeribacter naphthalenivorans]
MKGDRFGLTRLVCVFAIGTSLMGSTAPSPLYGTYVTVFGLSDVMAMAIFVVYAIGILSSLLITPFMARILPRQEMVLVIGLFITASGLICFALADHVAMLYAGRILNGAGAGMITGIASVRLYELAPEKVRARAAMVSTLAFSIGAAIGPMLTSLALAVDVAPTLIPFLTIAALCGVALVGVLLSRWPDHIRPVEVPDVIADGHVVRHISSNFQNRFFALACMGLGLSWYCASVLMGLGPHIGVQLFGLGSAGLAGLLPVIFQLASGVGQIALGRKDSIGAIILGGVGMTGCLVVLLLGLQVTNGLLLLLVMPLMGAFYGAIFVGALGLANQAALPEKRTEYTAWFYVAGHLCGLTPTMAMGFIVGSIGLERAFYAFVASMTVLTFGLCFLALVWLRANRAATGVVAQT